MELSRDKIIKAFYKVIAGNRGADPVTVAEKLADRLDNMIDDADSGTGRPISIIREEVIDEEEWRGDPTATRVRNDLVKQRKERDPETAYPPPASSGLIISPSEDEYRKALAIHAKEKTAPGPVPVRVSQVHEPPSPANAEPKMYWDYAGLAAKLASCTPEEMYFTPNGKPDLKVKAVRNIYQMIGSFMVRLEYANPEVSGDRAPEDPDKNGPFVIGLTAMKTFSLTDKSFSIDVAMAGIVTQLQGLYRDRTGLRSEVDIGPAPIDSWNMNNSPMGGKVEIRGQRGWVSQGQGFRTVEVGGTSFEVPNTAPAFEQSMRESNGLLGTPGYSPGR